MIAEKGDLLRSKLGLITQEDFVKTGKGVMYREVDIQEWLKRNVVPVVRAGS